MTRFNALLRRHLRRRADEGSALLGAVLFTIIIAGMAVVLLSVVVTAVYPATVAQARGRTVYNAEAGLQSALGILRAAMQTPAKVDPKTGSYLGDRAKLPCTISGTTDGIAGSQEAYEVSMRYYLENPSGKDDAWRTANALTCPLTASSVQPYFALIEATGTTGPVGESGDAGNRRLSAIYEFTVSNERILGGRIYTYGGGKYCLEATATPPASGEPPTTINVKFTPAAQCTSARNATQLWEYTTDWHLKLSSTSDENGNGGYCITAPVTTTRTETSEYREAKTNETWAGKDYSPKSGSASTPYVPQKVRVSGNGTAYNSVTNTAEAWDRSWSVNYNANTWYASKGFTATTTVTPNNGVLTSTRTQYTYTTTYTDTYQVSLPNNKTESRTVSRTYVYKQYAYLKTDTITETNYTAELHPCRTDKNSYGWGQIFAWDGDATWKGLSTSGSHTSVDAKACLWSGKSSGGTESAWTLAATDLLQVGNGSQACASQAYWGSFNPEPAVGAGRATPDFVDGKAVPVTRQLVSFKEFGRCADVTSASITTANSLGYNIVYPCKQDPISNSFAWNHKWFYNSPSVGYTNTTAIWVYDTKNNCLQTPDPTTNAKYPTWVTCTVNPSTTLPSEQRQRWTRYEYTGVYSRSYIFVDQWNRCLTADSSDPYTGAGQAWSKITVAPCNGSEAQKWNAPAYLTDASFGDYREITG